MKRKIDRDFKDMLCALSTAGAEFLLVGAHAMAAHNTPRYTGDMDLWVRPSDDNARRVWAALAEFGAPLGDLEVTQADLCKPDMILQLGVPPFRIDIITSLSGLTFDDAWSNRVEYSVEELRVPLICKADLIRNKRATGREKDLIDVKLLEKSGDDNADE